MIVIVCLFIPSLPISTVLRKYKTRKKSRIAYHLQLLPNRPQFVDASFVFEGQLPHFLVHLLDLMLQQCLLLKQCHLLHLILRARGFCLNFVQVLVRYGFRQSRVGVVAVGILLQDPFEGQFGQLEVGELGGVDLAGLLAAELEAEKLAGCLAAAGAAAHGWV